MAMSINASERKRPCGWCRTDLQAGCCRPDSSLSKDYEYRVQTSETMIDLAAIRLMLNRIAPA
jgi:hypothetical protein